MKISIKTLLLIMIAASAETQTLDFSYNGNLRVGAQYHDSANKEGNDLALGGMLHTETKPREGVTFGATVYTSNALFNQNDQGAVSFYDSTSRSYAILSEAYVKGEFGNTMLIFGRQIIDTPFLESDDIGMIPNTFEAYTMVNQDIKDMRLLYAYVRNMSGVDAEIPEIFSDINGDSGVHIVGVNYEGIEDVTLGGWFYALPNLGKFTYLEAGIEKNYNSFNYQLGAQCALQDFHDSKTANIFGLSARIMNKESALSLMLAYNKSSGGAVDNGFGGGPFFSISENMTLAETGADGEMLTYGLDWDVSEKLLCSLNKSDLYDAQDNHGYEVDMLVHYALGDNLSFDAIYSKIDNTDISGDKFDNVRVFANYSF